MSSISRNAIEACGCPGHLVSDSGIATKRGWGRGDPSRAPPSSTATESRSRVNDLRGPGRVRQAEQPPGNQRWSTTAWPTRGDT